MGKNGHWSGLYFTNGDDAERKRYRRAVAAGQLLQLAKGIYSADLLTAPEDQVRQNWQRIVSFLLPNAVISFRSGLELIPTPSGELFVTYATSKKVVLPGMVIHAYAGPGPLAGDQAFGNKPLYYASEARALLENLSQYRTKTGSAKCLSIEDIENRLVQILTIREESGLNLIRDQATTLAAELGLNVELQKLNKLISALLNSAPANLLKSKSAIAFITGQPIDQGRITLFEKLFYALKQAIFPLNPINSKVNQEAFSFFEAYFSNYIEGTIFKLEQALSIIEMQQPIFGRHADSHDILSTYQLITSAKWRAKVPASNDDFLVLLQQRHQVLLAERPDKRPGLWKERANQAGNTQFVEPMLVKGTLLAGYDYYSALPEGLARAIMVMFITSEVHPFDDGNGRLARLMMNAELSVTNGQRLVVTTFYRHDYLRALRKLSRQGDPSLLLRFFLMMQVEMSRLSGQDIERLNLSFQQLRAFHEEGDDD